MKATLFICLCLVVVSLVSDVRGYSVIGNKIYDPNGDEVILRGVDRCSLEWSATGEDLSQSDYNLMAGWGANVVRVSLSQDTWLDSSEGPAYQKTVAQQVEWIRNTGMGAIFDLHWNQGGQQEMADHNSITFWSQFATIYQTNPWVIFELYNEPHDIAWSVWLNGDSSWAGMQQLYASVRATGAANLVIVNGLNYAFDLSGVASNPVVGTNIAYGTHPYDYSGKQIGDWPAAFGYLAPTYPVIMTEFGQYCDSDTYVADLLAYAEGLGLSWTAWAWYVNGCSFPSIIADWDGTPLGTPGQTVQSYLGGKGGIIPTSAPVQVIPASSPLVVYSDSLQNGFEDWSWSTAYSLSDSTFVHSGKDAIKMAVQNDEAIYFHTTNDFTLGSYVSLQLYITGGTASIPASDLSVLIYDANENQVGVTVVFTTSAPAGSWAEVSILLTAFGAAASSEISGVAIMADISGDVGTVWIDDISFVPASGGSAAATTSTATTASSTAATTGVKASTSTTTGVKASTATTGAKASTATTASSTAATTGVKASTSATASSATTGAPSSSGSSTGCGASSILITQTSGGSWASGGSTVSQYTVTISSTCTTKSLTALTLSLSNWSPLPGEFWGLTVTSTTAVVPIYNALTPSTPITNIGYQNTVGEAVFTVLSFTFQ